MLRQITVARVLQALSLFACSTALLGCGQIHRLGRVSSGATPPGLVSVDGSQDGVSVAGHTARYSVAAVPTPKEIFDFHPAGARPGSFREAFVIDPDDGPLAAYVRRTAAELRAFNEQINGVSAIASAKPCYHPDVTKGQVGCDELAVRAGGVPSRKELPLKSGVLRLP